MAEWINKQDPCYILVAWICLSILQVFADPSELRQVGFRATFFLPHPDKLKIQKYNEKLSFNRQMGVHRR